jgi:hypothetical protein
VRGLSDDTAVQPQPRQLRSARLQPGQAHVDVRTSEQHSADSCAIPLIAQQRFRLKVGSQRAYEEIEGELPPPIFCDSSYRAAELLGLDSGHVSTHVNHPDRLRHVKGYTFKRATKEEIDAHKRMRANQG